MPIPAAFSFFAAARVRTRGCGALMTPMRLYSIARGKNYHKSTLMVSRQIIISVDIKKSCLFRILP